MHSAAGGYTSVITLSVGSVPVDQALNENGSRIEAWLAWVDWSSALVTVTAPVIVLPRNVRRTPRRRSRHSTMIVAVKLRIILPTAFTLQG